jgi:hypothetical protein
MRLPTKFLVWAWIILIVVFGGLVLSAYNKLNPESLVMLLNEQARKNYPGSVLKVDEVDYGVSLDFNLKLQNLSLTRNDKAILKAQEVQLKIPWWLVLFNRGNAQININYLDIFVADEDVPKETKTITAGSVDTKENIRIDVPTYLMDANYTLRAKKVSIRDLQSDRRYFTFSKLLVREFQYGRNSAFEMTIPITITHKEKKYVSELWLFGDVTPNAKDWSLNYRGEFKTRDITDSFEFEDLVLDGKSYFNPANVDFLSQMDISIDRKKVGTGKISGKAHEIQASLKFDQFPMEYLSMIGEEIHNPFLKKLEGLGEGEFLFTRPISTREHASISAKLSFPGKFNISEDIAFQGQWHLGFENDRIESSFIAPNSEVKFFRRSKIDFEQRRISQFSQELEFNGVPLEQAIQAVENLGDYVVALDQTYHSSLVSIRKSPDGDRVVEGAYRYGVSPYQKFYQVELSDGKGNLNLNYSSKTTNNQLEISFSKFVYRPYYQFLHPYFSTSKGELDGKVEGNWSDEWINGKWLVKLNGTDLQTPTGDFILFNQKIWDNFNVLSGNFSERSWNANVSDQALKLTSIALNGADPAIISGSLSAKPKSKSHLILNYPKNKKWKPVRKDLTEVFWKKDNP